MPKCNQCRFKGEPGDFEPSMSPYHDFKCPKCGTSSIDTTDCNSDGRYGYGNNNVLKMPGTSEEQKSEK